MASSFKLYNDSGLTSAFTGTLSATHNTDLSDNPQDFQLWFGSTETDRTLEAVSNPGVDNVTLTPTDNVAEWVANTAYSLGDTVQPTGGGNTYIYVCSTAGVSDASVEPTWPTSGIGSTVVDNTVVWTLRGKIHEPTEIKLALTAAGLAGATAGAALNLGTTIDSGVANAVEVNIRITNAVTTVSDTTGYPDLTLDLNSCQEATA